MNDKVETLLETLGVPRASYITLSECLDFVALLMEADDDDDDASDNEARASSETTS
jgi:hypothetical protein